MIAKRNVTWLGLGRVGAVRTNLHESLFGVPPPSSNVDQQRRVFCTQKMTRDVALKSPNPFFLSTAVLLNEKIHYGKDDWN